jgi:hypothetical protein
MTHMDELDSLFEPEAGVPASATAGLIIVQTALRGLAGPMPDFAAATQTERADIVRELEMVRAIRRAANDREKALELCVTRAADALGALELHTSEGTVRVKPSDPGYQVEEQALRSALITCVGMGDVTKAEVDAAITEVISYKPDHRKLNALLKRGDRVKAAIEDHRRKGSPDIMHGRVEAHRPGGLS